jgi:hypothetical protein
MSDAEYAADLCFETVTPTATATIMTAMTATKVPMIQNLRFLVYADLV